MTTGTKQDQAEAAGEALPKRRLAERGVLAVIGSRAEAACVAALPWADAATRTANPVAGAGDPEQRPVRNPHPARPEIAAVGPCHPRNGNAQPGQRESARGAGKSGRLRIVLISIPVAGRARAATACQTARARHDRRGRRRQPPPGTEAASSQNGNTRHQRGWRPRRSCCRPPTSAIADPPAAQFTAARERVPCRLF